MKKTHAHKNRNRDKTKDLTDTHRQAKTRMGFCGKVIVERKTTIRLEKRVEI